MHRGPATAATPYTGSVRCQLWTAQYEPSGARQAVTSQASGTRAGTHAFSNVFQTGSRNVPQPPE